MEDQNDYHLSDKERREQKKEAQRLEARKGRQAERRRRWFLWGGLAVALLVVVIGASRLANTGSSVDQPLLSNDTIEEGEWTKGNPEASIELIEYSDFQCPACGLFFPAVKELSEQYADDVLVVYRHYPLRSIHEHAQLAGQAAEAAGMQGKFWEMHDMLFERQSEWSSGLGQKATFARYAQELGLDVERFRADMTSDVARDAVNRGYISAVAAGVNSTPTFFLNGEPVSVAPTVSAFAELIDPLISASATGDATNEQGEDEIDE